MRGRFYTFLLLLASRSFNRLDTALFCHWRACVFSYLAQQVFYIFSQKLLRRLSYSSSQERLRLSVEFFIFLQSLHHHTCILKLGLQLPGFLLQILDFRSLSSQDLAPLLRVLLKLSGRVQSVSLNVATWIRLFALAYGTFRAFHLQSTLYAVLRFFLGLFVFVSEHVAQHIHTRFVAYVSVSFAPLIFFEISFGRHWDGGNVVHWHWRWMRLLKEHLLLLRWKLAHKLKIWLEFAVLATRILVLMVLSHGILSHISQRLILLS